MKHFLSIAPATRDQLEHLLDVAFHLREQRRQTDAGRSLLAGKTLVMIFEKPSLRTRVSFEQATLELGGHAMMVRSAEVGLGTRESPADVARVLSGMVHGIMARVFEHQKLLDLAEASSVPVINALSDESHPCQALADVMTIMDEFGRDLEGRTLAFIGDGNNVARSLAVICAKFGMHFTVSCPAGYELGEGFLDRVRAMAPKMKLAIEPDPKAAVANADVIYTDTWVSMGQEEQTAQRRKEFADYQLNGELLTAAPPNAIVLHCMPAYRNLEITEEVIDGPRSRVFPQAHNRLHAQKGLLAVLMGGA